MIGEEQEIYLNWLKKQTSIKENKKNNYSQLLNPNKKTIIVFHGALGNRYNCLTSALYLKKFFNVVLFDLPLHGSRMFETNQDLTLDTSIEVTLDLLNKLELINGYNKKDFTNINNNNNNNDEIKLKNENDDGLILMGLSMGGYIAYGFAKKFPQLINVLITNGALHDYGGNSKSIFSGIQKFYNILPNKILYNLIGWTFPSGEDSQLTDILFKRLFVNYDYFSKCCQIMTSINCIEDALPTFIKNTNSFKNKGFVLFIQGQKDFRTHEKQMLKVCKENSNNNSNQKIDLKIIENGGHLVAIQNTKQFIEHLLNFFKTNVELKI
jgi:pimeloyl-ACP methyl ester carboxylesterase